MNIHVRIFLKYTFRTNSNMLLGLFHSRGRCENCINSDYAVASRAGVGGGWVDEDVLVNKSVAAFGSFYFTSAFES